MLSTVSFRFEPNPRPMDAAERAQRLADPVFGRVHTDHMAIARYSSDRGWHDAKITSRGPLSLDPATSVLHYAQEIFEGMKAYRHPDGSVALFRPEANARRFVKSAQRMAMPELPEAMFLEGVRSLVRADQDWVPNDEYGSLYLRPFMFANEVVLGVKPSAEYLFIVLASPAGRYFRGESSAVTLWVTRDYIRAAPGGTGEAKCGGNYAASLIAQAESIREGCDQVVFLDAIERRFVEELGGMNIFFVFEDGSIQTPPLAGTILHGITRDSIIALARDEGRVVREEPYAIEQWEADARSGRLTEAFACGTAAVVAAIGRVRGKGIDFSIGGQSIGPATQRLRERLVSIQRGTAPDPFGWVEKVVEVETAPA